MKFDAELYLPQKTWEGMNQVGKKLNNVSSDNKIRGVSTK